VCKRYLAGAGGVRNYVRLIWIAIGLVAALLVSGCGSTSGAPSVGRVTYEVSGGFTGWDRVLTVERDGTYTVAVVRGPSPAAGGKKVDAAVLQRLHALVADPEFARLEAAYLPGPGGADLQDYLVTAEVGGKTIKTMSRDGATVPANLREVQGILNGILSAAN